MNDVRKTIYGTIIGFFMMLGLWFSIIYVSSCGFTLTCFRGDLTVVRTPIPTLIPVSHPDTQMDANMDMPDVENCQATALDLIGAWVSAETPETEPFLFTSVNDQTCEGSYADDIQPLFVENSVWQPGSLGCVSCHNADLSDRSAGLDITSISAIQGSGILGDDWESSRFYEVLGMGLTADGHSSDVSAGNPLVYVGSVVVIEAEATPTP